jgi:hypothetical protein
MKRFMNKKVAVIGLAAGLALGAAGAAFAYLTTTGSGTATATGGSNTALTLTQTGSVTGLVPGATGQQIAYQIVNTAGNGDQNLGAVSGTVTGSTGGENASVCNSNASTWFTVTTSGGVIGTIANGATYSSVTGSEPTIQEISENTSQDACIGATIDVSLSAAAGS